MTYLAMGMAVILATCVGIGVFFVIEIVLTTRELRRIDRIDLSRKGGQVPPLQASQAAPPPPYNDMPGVPRAWRRPAQHQDES